MADANVYRLGIYRALLPLANLLSLIFGVIYIFGSADSVLWNIYGLLLIMTLLGNLIPIFTTTSGRKLDTLYLLLFTASMLIVPLSNTIVSITVTDMDSRSFLSYILLIAIFLLGEINSCVRLFEYRTVSSANLAPSSVIFGTRSFYTGSRKKKAARVIFTALLFLVLIIGFYLLYDLLDKNNDSIMGVFVPEYSFFYGLFFLGTACLIIRLNHRRHRSVLNLTAFIAGLILFVGCSFPMISVPGLLNSSEKAYTEAFGPVKETLTEQDEKILHYRPVPFSIPAYFFGIPSEPYDVQKNILFYIGTNGVDKGIKLYMDVYAPPSGAKIRSGKYPVLVRIHGGGWTVGDKGSFNFAQMNKYFASRGYVVFDIQYGLNNGKKFVEYAPVPGNVLGDFSVDDMVRHIGLFTKYLADHQKDYNADPDSVFISGGSAGGHLALAAGLAIAGGKYDDLLDSRLNIRGIIPFYPGNGMADDFGIQGSEELVDPALLIVKDGPPCLIFQGTHDGLVSPDMVDQFIEACHQKGNSRCALISMPYGGHASDLYFTGYYNQVFLYYMERFMHHFS